MNCSLKQIKVDKFSFLSTTDLYVRPKARTLEEQREYMSALLSTYQKLLH